MSEHLKNEGKDRSSAMAILPEPIGMSAKTMATSGKVTNRLAKYSSRSGKHTRIAIRPALKRVHWRATNPGKKPSPTRTPPFLVRVRACTRAFSTKLDSIINTTQGKSPEELAAENSQALNSAAASAKKVNAAIGANAAKSGDSNPGVESPEWSRRNVLRQTRRSKTICLTNRQKSRKTIMPSVAKNETRQSNPKKLCRARPLVRRTGAAGEVSGANAQVSQQANANEQSSTSWLGLVGGLASSAATALIPKIPGLGPKPKDS